MKLKRSLTQGLLTTTVGCNLRSNGRKSFKFWFFKILQFYLEFKINPELLCQEWQKLFYMVACWQKKNQKPVYILVRISSSRNRLKIWTDVTKEKKIYALTIISLKFRICEMVQIHQISRFASKWSQSTVPRLSNNFTQKYSITLFRLLLLEPQAWTTLKI